MVNLSYDNDSVPCLGFDESMENLTLMNRNYDWRIPLNDLVSLCHGDQVELDYLFDRLTHPLGLPVCCPEDISLFMKRFNKYCFKHVTFKYNNFRYFCAHEYGPTTFRCHAHVLFFFNDRLIANRFSEILRACWRYGDAPYDSVYSNGGFNYVAQYVNMSSHLPSFLTHSRLRPRPQFSKSPVIGSLPVLDETLRDIYERLPLYRTVWDSGYKRYLTLPNTSSYNARFFPKCPRYSELSFDDRVTLYGVSDWFDTEGSFEGFWKRCQDLRWLRSRSLCNKSELVLSDYIDFVEKFSDSPDTLRNSLRRLYVLSIKVCWFASRLGTSVRWLVSRIDEYWRLVDYEHLKDFYSYQVQFAQRYGSKELILMYPVSYQSIKFSDGIYRFFDYAKDSFGLRSDEELPELKDTRFYKIYKDSCDNIFKDSHKSHEINSYLYSRKFGASDPKLQKILIKYHSKRKIHVET